jgi:NADPH:quinone reductase-like Zn-dependent oxidoreductase
LLAAVLNHPGPASTFRIEQVPVPATADNEVLVRVKACGVSYRDVLERNGTYRRDVTFPLVQGLEIAGIVERVGPGVRHLQPGDRVCSKAFSSCGQCRYCRTGRETTCRQRRPVRGGYAEYTAMPEDAFVKIPHGLPFETAAVLGPGAGVALNALRDVAHTAIGDIVLVTGATGGVGLPAVQLARIAGATVIAVTRDAQRRDALLEAGAHHVVVSGTDNIFAAQVRTLTDDEGADVVIDTVGSRVFNEAFDSLALHGRYAMVGQLAGEEIKINPARIFFKRAQLLGVGSVSRAQLSDVIELATKGLLKPRIARVMKLQDVAEAHRMVEASVLFGRIVLTP